MNAVLLVLRKIYRFCFFFWFFFCIFEFSSFLVDLRVGLVFPPEVRFTWKTPQLNATLAVKFANSVDPILIFRWRAIHDMSDRLFEDLLDCRFVRFETEWISTLCECTSRNASRCTCKLNRQLCRPNIPHSTSSTIPSRPQQNTRSVCISSLRIAAVPSVPRIPGEISSETWPMCHHCSPVEWILSCSWVGVLECLVATLHQRQWMWISNLDRWQWTTMRTKTNDDDDNVDDNDK